MVQKTNLGKKILGQIFFPDFGAQIGQQHFFINHFSQTLAQMAPQGISQFLGPKSKEKKSLIALSSCKTYNTFLTIGPNKGELLF